MKRNLLRIFRSAAIAAIAVVTFSACAAVQANSGTAQAQEGQGRPSSLFGIVIGSRSLDDDTAWDQIESPFVVGFEGGTVGDPVGFEVGLSFAGDSTTVSGVDVTNTFLELSLGARGVFGDGPLFPYVGGGVALITAEVEGESGGSSVSDDDASVGLYGHGGVLYRLGVNFFVGIDARLVTGTSLEIFGIDSDADYTQIAAVLGWGS
ncbi:MAG: outer membrane beta-barrel protein [Planctomycetes bacterium]|nr:outer membrane beta-barrel protein [Planctomycetota bacterium]